MAKCKNANEDVDVNVNEDRDYEDLDEEEEEEEEEEELDMAAGDNEISLDSHGYFPIRLKDIDTESSSRSYLQGLFDSFPTGEHGSYGDFAVDDGSDGEIPIYEEESDGLYSIDDGDDEEEEEEDDDDDE